MSWTLLFTRQAQKDAQKIAASNLKLQTQRLLDLIANNPFQNPPPFEKMVGDLSGAFSRRINIQHRLVYQVYADLQSIKVIRIAPQHPTTYQQAIWDQVREVEQPKLCTAPPNGIGATCIDSPDGPYQPDKLHETAGALQAFAPVVAALYP